MEYLKSYRAYHNEDLIIEGINLTPFLDKFKRSVNKKVVANIIIGSLLSVLTTNQILNFIDSRQDITEDEKNLLVDTVSKFKDPTLMFLSQDGWEHIKEEEKLRLTVYKIGDGMVTVGYGHAERIGKTKLKVGQKITYEEAMQFLITDVNTAAQGVKRMFKQWKDEGVEVYITQNQYDVLVSMAFNLGVKGLRRTEFVEHLKNNDFEKAAHKIKETGISSKFPGLYKRRLREFELFISD